jgi:hypothetical protein
VVGVVTVCRKKLAPAKPPAATQPAEATKPEGAEPTGFQPGVYYECEEGMPDNPDMWPVQTTKWYVCADKVRIEIGAQHHIPSPFPLPDDLPPSSMEPTVSILRRDLGVTYLLAPRRMVYTEDKRGPVEKGAEGQVWGEGLQVTATETRETQKIGQYMCTGYDLTVKSETSSGPPLRYWVTKDVDLGVEMSPVWHRQFLPPLAEAVAKLPGFAIQGEFPLPDGKVVTTVTTIRKEDMPDSLFEVPAGYRKSGRYR